MKTLTKTLLYVCGLTLVPLALTAANEQASAPKEYQLDKYTVEELTPPIPTKMVAPKIRRGIVGTEVRMLFRVNEQGRAIGAIGQNSIRNLRTADLAAAMSTALRSWEFEPARDSEGVAVAVKAALPVKVIKKQEGGKTYAAFDLGKLEVIRRTN